MRLFDSAVSRFIYLIYVIVFSISELSATTNIILIVTDDQRWDATGFMQERMPSLGRTARFPWMENHTPNLDRLSEEGIHFDNAYGVYSLCSPARATMLTGQYPHKHGITNNQTDFPSDVVTYANLLQAAGYTTGYFGKWHMGTQAERPGFDYARTFYGQGKYFGTVFNDENGNPVDTNANNFNSQSTQSIVINVTGLPSNGANQSIYRTTDGSPYYQNPARALTIGQNTFSITTSVTYDRGVFYRFTSGEVEFDSLVYNGKQLLSNPGVATTIQASGIFEAVSNNDTYPYRIGISAAGVTTWGGTDEWIDDTSTNYAVKFIEDQASSGNPFMLFLGFKTPHQGTQNGVSNWYPPARTDGIFSGQLSASVPNLGLSPPYAPNASGGNSGNVSNQNYCETIAGIDGCVGNILDAVEVAGIDDETVIIFISDNGFFRGEHGLSDKRAAYEESIRLPFMIRHPSIQTKNGLIVNDIVSNLDIAPTILDLAGLEVPASMQGASLVPFIRGEAPNDWRDQLFIEYQHDAEFPTANVRPYISLVHENGLKIVRYQENASWDELFDTRTSADPYEINNIINSDQQNRASMQELLIKESFNTDFLKILQNNMTDSGGTLTLSAGEGSPFKLESSSDLESWSEEGSFEGDNEAVTISVLNSKGYTRPTMSYSTTLNGKSLEPFTVSFSAINLYNYIDLFSRNPHRDLLYDNTDSPTSWSIEMGSLSSPATVTVEFLPTPTEYSTGTFSVFNSIQTDIWDASVDVLGQTATFKQVAQVSGVTSGATITGSIDTTRSDNYVDIAAMRITFDYNPGQLRYNIDFGASFFDANDNDAASGFGTSYYTWNTNSTTASFNPFSAADPTFGDYASILESVTVIEDGYDSDVSLKSISVIGNDGDHVLRSSTPPVAIDAYAYSTLAVGSTTAAPSGGRNAVLIFELPSIESDEQIHSATVAVTVERLNQKTDFDADLWSLGIYDSNGIDPDGDGLVDYHEIPTSNTNLVKLQDAFLNDLIAGTDSETQSVRVASSPVSRLSNYLWQFYNSNPGYRGGKYLHLRVSPEIGSVNNIGSENVRYTIKAAHNDNSDQEKPKLTIELKDLSDVAKNRFFRVRYGED
ncbi:MAG: sulfatase-like hydrolase/transferase [Verrucomicrobiota bacterium]|nr:sulfatase-like hydrolase/transferase [Verrucomicrobiota bacterium]